MHALDNEFFEEYKRLDRLCADMYSGRNGVSEYLEDMESKAYRGQSRVADWAADYRRLKHVRWVRNQIAHAETTGQICEAADTAFVREFRQRILAGQDPLALLRKAGSERQSETRRENDTPGEPAAHRRRTSGAVFAAVFAGLAVLLLLAFLLLDR